MDKVLISVGAEGIIDHRSTSPVTRSLELIYDGTLCMFIDPAVVVTSDAHPHLT